MRRVKLLLSSVPMVLGLTMSTQCASLRPPAPARGAALVSTGVPPDPAAPVVAPESKALAMRAAADTETAATTHAAVNTHTAEQPESDVAAEAPAPDERKVATGTTPAGNLRAKSKASSHTGARVASSAASDRADAAKADAEPAPETSSLYELKIDATPKLDKGAKGAVSARIVPKAGAHLSDEAPVSLALSAPASLALSKTKATKADVKYASGGGAIEVPFTAVEAGKATIEAKLKFYICTEKTCAQQEKTASLPVMVR
jgi:hypothetical protein